MALEYVLTSYLDTYFRFTRNMTQKRNQWQFSVGGEALPSSQQPRRILKFFPLATAGI